MKAKLREAQTFTKLGMQLPFASEEQHFRISDGLTQTRCKYSMRFCIERKKAHSRGPRYKDWIEER